MSMNSERLVKYIGITYIMFLKLPNRPFGLSKLSKISNFETYDRYYFLPFEMFMNRH